MEEVVGKIWHKWLTKQVTTEYIGSAAYLEPLQAQLSLFYRALGGNAAKTITLSQPHYFNLKRSTLQKISGSHKKFLLAWQDDNNLCMPPMIALFADQALNEFLYFWLVALAAHITERQMTGSRVSEQSNWLIDNQIATVKILAKYPGLKQKYFKLVPQYLLTRADQKGASEVDKPTEQAISELLLKPQNVLSEHLTAFDFTQFNPVNLWLYPAPYFISNTIKPADPQAKQKNKVRKTAEIKIINQRKKVQYLEDKRKTDGLLIFQAESLSTWTEQINLDRCQEEGDDDDIEEIAKDLDIINLSRHRKAGSARIRFDLDLPAEHNDDLRLGDGILLPEWDFKKQQLLNNHCLLQIMLADEVKPIKLSRYHQQLSNKILPLFRELGTCHIRNKAQYQGDEIDLDAWIENHIGANKAHSRENFYLNNRQKIRDVSCLILADLSLSTEAFINNEQRIIDVIRDSLIVFAEALHSLHDKFAIYGFSSVRNQHVRYQLLKNFNMPYNEHVRGRIARIKPGYYTRMGAAIRQSCELLTHSQSLHKILLIVSDGKPNDLDQYEGRYGLEDTRHAILAAKQQGLLPYCVTIDKNGNDYLPYLFGENGYAVIENISQLPSQLAKIYLNLTAQ